MNTRAQQIVTNVGTLSPASLNTAFRFIEQHDLVTTKIVCHANQYASIRIFGKDFYDEATTREILTSGLFGQTVAELKSIEIGESCDANPEVIRWN